MKKLFPLTVVLFSLLLFNSSYGQSCTDCRYLSPVFDSVVVDTGIHFAHGLNSDGNMQELYMDVYHPYGDTVKNRPLAIFAFGGAFIKGSRTDWYVIEACRLFAKSGYVAAAIDYRVGINVSEVLGLQYMRIFFRPMQDMRAAVQYFKADYAERGNNYSIDTNRIIISGASSGGITALMTAYCDKPTEITQMGNISALDVLGGFYSSSGFDTNYSWRSLATVSISGALINADWIEPGDQPVMMAHGDKDTIVPYADGGGGKGLFGIDLSAFGFNMQGSYLVDSIAKTKGVCSYLYTMKGWGHPTEDMGIEYVRSVVYRIMERMHAVVNNRSFCCPLAVDVQPNDTLLYGPGDPATTLSAQITGDSGHANLQWCSISCGYTSTAPTISVLPDSNLKYVIAIASENHCQANDLYMVSDSTLHPSSISGVKQIDFSIFPQPASDNFSVRADLSAYAGKRVVLEVLDMEGRSLLSRQIMGSRNSEALVDVRALTAGSYLVVLKSGGGVLGVRKVIIAR